MKKITYVKLYIIFILITMGIFTPSMSKNPETKTNNHTDSWITIFVHGIISAVPVMTFKALSQIGNNDIDGTFYKKYVSVVRKDKFFCRNQAKQGIGLKKIDQTRKDANDGCPALAKIFELQSLWSEKNFKIKNYYYTFGWSGLLNPKSRYDDAKKFHEMLSHEIKYFQQKGISPKIRLIGFSHGASVCLNLAAVRKKENIEKNFKIEELIMLGIPIQPTTDFLVGSPIFKKVYNFYSLYDRVQVLDFSHKGRLFSRRRLKSTKNLVIPDNLVQIQLELLRKSPKFCLYKDNKIKIRSPFLRRSSPGHCEWWFFQWTNKFYRKKFGIAPLPVVSIIPTLIDVIQKTNIEPFLNNNCKNKITISLIPDKETMIIKNKKTKKVVKFLTNNQMDQLKNSAYSFPFKKITTQEYNEKVEEAKKKAANEK